jgi:hypothetical protein
MWLMTPSGFLSIVDKAKTPGCLVVRSRVRKHIESAFPKAKIQRTPGNDYLFRAEIRRDEVADAVHAQVMAITYDNHKGATKDDRLHGAYHRVWNAMATLQEIPPYETRKRLEPFDFAGQA